MTASGLVSPTEPTRTSSQPARSENLKERRLARFSDRHRATVETLARRHLYLSDLAVCFPALLFALAVPRRGFDPEPVIKRVIAGEKLADLARAAGVPAWMRALMPELLTAPLPVLPDGEVFRCQIANHLPRSPRYARIWLEAVAEAARWGHEELAVWIAREIVANSRKGWPKRARLLCLWSWYTSAAGTRGHAFIGEPWTPRLSYSTARKLAEEWCAEVSLHLWLGQASIVDVWLKPGVVDGFEFVPLRSVEEIAAEASAMKNCLRGYGRRLVHGHCRLWSIRRAGERIANVEIRRLHRSRVPCILQLRGKKNTETSDELYAAVTRWIGGQDRLVIKRDAIRSARSLIDPEHWRAFWRPYWLAKGRIPAWLPLAPSDHALWEL